MKCAPKLLAIATILSITALTSMYAFAQEVNPKDLASDIEKIKAKSSQEFIQNVSNFVAAKGLVILNSPPQSQEAEPFIAKGPDKKTYLVQQSGMSSSHMVCSKELGNEMASLTKRAQEFPGNQDKDYVAFAQARQETMGIINALAEADTQTPAEEKAKQVKEFEELFQKEIFEKLTEEQRKKILAFDEQMKKLLEVQDALFVKLQLNCLQISHGAAMAKSSGTDLDNLVQRIDAAQSVIQDKYVIFQRQIRGELDLNACQAEAEQYCSTAQNGATVCVLELLELSNGEYADSYKLSKECTAALQAKGKILLDKVSEEKISVEEITAKAKKEAEENPEEEAAGSSAQ